MTNPIDGALAELERAAALRAGRGSLIFHLDLAGTLASAAFAGEGLEGAPVVIVDDDGYAAACVDESLPPRVLASVRFAADGRPVLTREPGVAPPPLDVMAAATRTLAAAFAEPGVPRAFVVVPPGPGEPIEGYTIRLAARSGGVVIGVHWRATLDPFGREVTSREPLARATLELPAVNDCPPPFAEVTHFDATPGEMHHYLSLKHGIVLDVMALRSSTRWRVEGEQVRLLGPLVQSGSRRSTR